MTATARATNSKGYRTRRGNRFDRRGINRILTNRFYIGEVVWNGYTFQGTHEIRTSITSIFDDVQKRLEKSTALRNAVKFPATPIGCPAC